MEKRIKNCVLIGASSVIVHHVAREFARSGASFLLIGRNQEKMQQVADDLIAYGASGAELAIAAMEDLLHWDLAKIREQTSRMGNVDLLLFGAGYLGEQVKAEVDDHEANAIIAANYTMPALILGRWALLFAEQKDGLIAVISSVAGERGRALNYYYASAKSGMSVYLQGLRGRMYRYGVDVCDVRPGYVRTPMTIGLKTGSLLFADPTQAGIEIFNGIAARRATVYAPWFWRWIMLIIRWIPETIFKRLRF